MKGLLNSVMWYVLFSLCGDTPKRQVQTENCVCWQRCSGLDEVLHGVEGWLVVSAVLLYAYVCAEPETRLSEFMLEVPAVEPVQVTLISPRCHLSCSCHARVVSFTAIVPWLWWGLGFVYSHCAAYRGCKQWHKLSRDLLYFWMTACIMSESQSAVWL